MPVKNPENTTYSTGKSTRDQGPTNRPRYRLHALTRGFSTLTREKCHRSSRPDPHETRSRGSPELWRVGSGLVRRISKPCGSVRVGSGGFQNLAGRVGSGRVRRFSKSRGSGRVGSRRLEILAGRVGSGQSRRLVNLTTRPDPTGEI